GALNGSIVCRRSCAAMAKWQIKTFGALRKAYDALVEAYQESQPSGPRLELLGGSSADNIASQKRELRKWCKLLLGERPPSDSAYLFIDAWAFLEPAKASDLAFRARFFENVFEWDEMTFFLLGYETAPRERWADLLGSKSADPRHTE